MSESLCSPLEILDGRGKHLPTDRYAYKTSADGAGQYALDAIISELKDSEIDESKMCVMIPYANGQRRDGVGDLLEIGGIDLSRHKVNAIALLDHGKQTSWPLGMCLERDGTKYDPSKYTVELDPVAQVARANIYFYQGKGFQAGNSYGADARKVPLSKDEEFEHALLCEQTFDMVCKRMINGGSIGYQVKRANPLQPDYNQGTPQGLHLLETLQLEVSIVVLPANMDTVRKALSDNRCCGKPLSPCLVKSLTPHAAPRKAQMGYEGKRSQVPLNQDLSKTNIPPARWKPGLGAEKSHVTGHKTLPKFGSVQDVDKFVDGLKGASETEVKEVLIEAGIPANQHRADKHSMLQQLRYALQEDVGGGGNPPPGGGGRSRINYRKSQTPVKELRRKYGKGIIDKQGHEHEDSSGRFTSGSPKTHKQGTSYAVRSGGHSTNEGEFHDFRPGQKLKTRRGLTRTDSATRNVTNFASAGESVEIVRLNRNGSCVIRNSRGEEKEDWVTNLRKSLEAETKSLPGLRKKYRRPAKGFRRVLRKSSPGSALVYVRSKDLEACRCSAEKCGLKFSHMGRHATGLEKVKVSGDDKHIDAVAREWGRSVKTVRGKKSLNAKTKSQPWEMSHQEFIRYVESDSSFEQKFDRNYGSYVNPIDWRIYIHEAIKRGLPVPEKIVEESAFYDVYPGERARRGKKSLQGGNGMKTKGKDFDRAEGQNGAVGTEKPSGAGGGSDLGAQEPYGAQARRRIHQDLSILMQEYDQIRQLCEHDQVNAHLEELLQHFAEHLERIETEWEGDEVHKDLPPIEGAMHDKDMEGEVGENSLDEEPNEDEEEPLEADSGDSEEEEADEEDADATMKGLYRNVKALRKGIRKIAGPKTPKNPKNAPRFVNEDDIGNKPRRSSNTTITKKDPAKQSGFHTNVHKDTYIGSQANTPKQPKGKGVTPGYEEFQGKPGHRDVGDDIEGAPGYEEHQDKPGEGGGISLLPHHQKHVSEAHGFLGEVGGMDGGSWSDEHRMKSYHFHKALESVADELEGDDDSDHVPGHEEHQDKPGHSGTEDEFQGKAADDAHSTRASSNSPKVPPKLGRHSEMSRKRDTSSAHRTYLPSGVGKPKNPKGKALTEDELNQVEGELEGNFEDTEDDKHPHVKALRSASGLCHELSQTQELTDDHRIKALACHKELNPMLHEAEDDMDLPRDDEEEVDVEVGEMGEKALLELQEQNDAQARKMKDLSSTIVKLARLAN